MTNIDDKKRVQAIIDNLNEIMSTGIIHNPAIDREVALKFYLDYKTLKNVDENYVPLFLKLPCEDDILLKTFEYLNSHSLIETENYFTNLFAKSIEDGTVFNDYLISSQSLKKKVYEVKNGENAIQNISYLAIKTSDLNGLVGMIIAIGFPNSKGVLKKSVCLISVYDSLENAAIAKKVLNERKLNLFVDDMPLFELTAVISDLKSETHLGELYRKYLIGGNILWEENEVLSEIEKAFYNSETYFESLPEEIITEIKKRLSYPEDLSR